MSEITDKLCKGCQRFRHTYSAVKEKFSNPEDLDRLVDATFTLYKPGSSMSELPCDALEAISGEVPVDKFDYCKIGYCLALDTIEIEAAEKAKKEPIVVVG